MQFQSMAFEGEKMQANLSQNLFATFFSSSTYVQSTVKCIDSLVSGLIKQTS